MSPSLIWLFLGLLAVGSIRVFAARSAARRTGVTYWKAYASGWHRERLLGVPAGVLWVLGFTLVVATFLFLEVRGR